MYFNKYFKLLVFQLLQHCECVHCARMHGNPSRWVIYRDGQEIFCLPILRRVTAQINIWSELSLMQTRLSDLHRIFLRLDCPLDVCDRPLSIQDGVAYLYKRYNVQLDLFSANQKHLFSANQKHLFSGYQKHLFSANHKHLFSANQKDLSSANQKQLIFNQSETFIFS